MSKWLWFKIFAPLCVCFAIAAPFIGEGAVQFAFLLPFAHCGVYVLTSLVKTLVRAFSGGAYADEYYIRDNYPDLWKSMHPWGDHSHNSFGYFKLFGYETNDAELAEIVDKLKDDNKWAIAVFLLVPLVWLIGAVSLLYVQG